MFENVQEIILKVTRDCNLRCAYCYVRDKDRFKGERMSFAVFKKIIRRYVADQNKTGHQNKRQGLTLIFHGGEPTLLGARELLRFINYAKANIPYIYFGMQTNLTNISEELAMVLQKHNISPGISLDGLNTRLNNMRMNNIKQKLMQKGLQLLKHYHVNCGVLIVITKTNINKVRQSILSLLKKFPQQIQVKANYVENIYNTGLCHPEVSPEELFDNLFLPMIQYFQKKSRFIETNVESIVTRFFMSNLFGASNDHQDFVESNCNMKFCAGGNNVVEIDANGVICSCGRWDDIHDICRLGTVEDKDLFGLKSYDKVLSLQKNKAAYIRKLHCDFCPAASICDYGCLAFAYSKYKDIRIRTELVCVYFLKVANYLKAHASCLLKSFARMNGWNIHEEKKFYIFRLPNNYPKLNELTIATIPNWSIFDVEEKHLLKVRLC